MSSEATSNNRWAPSASYRGLDQKQPLTMNDVDVYADILKSRGRQYQMSVDAVVQIAEDYFVTPADAVGLLRLLEVEIG